MNKNQIVVLGIGIVLLIALCFAPTIPPNKKLSNASTADNNSNNVNNLKLEDILTAAHKKVSNTSQRLLLANEKLLETSDSKEQKIQVIHRLVSYWRDSIPMFPLANYYLGELAKLENSEKNLKFAAQQFLDSLIIESNPSLQNWMAANAKILFEKVLTANPNNDSVKIGLGSCYIFGNISSNPMEGILLIRQVAQKDSNNLYAQMMLGLGGRKSGQFDKAIERFSFILRKQPNNLEAIINLAECYDIKHEKKLAAKWYQIANQYISNEQVKKELDNRIIELNNK